MIGNGTGALSATTTSAGISGQLSDETGTGVIVPKCKPTLRTSLLVDTATANDDRLALSVVLVVLLVLTALLLTQT